MSDKKSIDMNMILLVGGIAIVGYFLYSSRKPAIPSEQELGNLMVYKMIQNGNLPWLSNPNGGGQSGIPIPGIGGSGQIVIPSSDGSAINHGTEIINSTDVTNYGLARWNDASGWTNTTVSVAKNDPRANALAAIIANKNAYKNASADQQAVLHAQNEAIRKAIANAGYSIPQWAY